MPTSGAMSAVGSAAASTTIDVDLRLGPAGTSSASQPFAITWAGSFSGQRAVRLQCSANGTDVRIYYLTMTAYKAGTLVEAPLE